PAPGGVPLPPLGLEPPRAPRRPGGRGPPPGVPLPVAHRPAVPVADPAHGVVAHPQAAELPQVRRRPVERPTGPGQAQQPLRLRADEASHADALVERVGRGAAARADEVQPGEPDRAGGRQQVAPGPALGPEAAGTAAADAAGRPFFSAAPAWACSAASTARRVNSRPAG